MPSDIINVPLGRLHNAGENARMVPPGFAVLAPRRTTRKRK